MPAASGGQKSALVMIWYQDFIFSANLRFIATYVKK